VSSGWVKGPGGGGIARVQALVPQGLGRPLLTPRGQTTSPRSLTSQVGHHDGMAEKHLGLHTELVDKIGRFDDRQGPARVRDLLHAEAAQRRVSPGLIEMSTAVHRADGGIDGQTFFDFDLPVVGAPAGHLVWQVKTGNENPRAAKELGSKAKHRDAQGAIRSGASHAPVWTSDQPSTVRRDVATAFETAAQAVRPDATVTVLTSENVADWVWAHAIVLAELLTSSPSREASDFPDRLRQIADIAASLGPTATRALEAAAGA